MAGSDALRPRTVCDLFAQQVHLRPNAIAVRTPTRTWTYSEFADVTSWLARRLRRRGAGPGIVVGLLARLGPAALIGLVATLRSGAASMPLDPDDPPRRLTEITKRAGCSFVIAENEASWCPDALIIGNSTVPDEAEDTTDSGGPTMDGPIPQDLAYAITTSGSTGYPKTVAVPHDALFDLIASSIDDFGLTAERDVVLWLSRPTVDVTMQDCLMALCSGASVAIPDNDSFLPTAILTAARTVGATVVDIPAAVVGAYGRSLLPRLARAGVRLVITGGSRLDGAGLAGAMDSLAVVNAYGPTETTVTATLYECPDPPPRWPPIGRPVRGVRTYVLDDKLESVAVGTAGQLYLAGKCVSWGYLGQPARTAAVFLPDPFADTPGQRMYATGDRVRLLPDGNLEFLDRIDNQVKVSGFRIEVGEVEHCLLDCPGVREAAVVAREGLPGGRALIAFLVCDDVVENAIKEHLSARLPRFMIPQVYRWLDEMPLNRQGKLDRQALARRPLHQIDTEPANSSGEERS